MNDFAESKCVFDMDGNNCIICHSYNLVTMAYQRGAHFVLGTTQTVIASQGQAWITAFFTKAATGAAIKDCIAFANTKQSMGIYYEGDVFAKLK